MLRFEEIRYWLRLPKYDDKEARQDHEGSVYRAKILGGWLVGLPGSGQGTTFVPDPEHKWDGNSLP